MKEAKSYLVHYGDANQSEPTQAIHVSYTESSPWTLASEDVPTLTEGDKLYFYVQAYFEIGVGETDDEKAKYLQEGSFTGSLWSEAAVVTK